ncbi:MAG: hypothetical protein AAF608_05160 [Pseudomonadota bacterium]
MISREKFLLALLAEEAAEVAQATIKAIRFGLQEVKEGTTTTNAQRLNGELQDLMGILTMLNDETSLDYHTDLDAVLAKRERVEKYYAYSKSIGEVQ